MGRKGGKRAPPPPPPGKRKDKSKLVEVNEDEVNDDLDHCASPVAAALSPAELSASAHCGACRVPRSEAPRSLSAQSWMAAPRLPWTQRQWTEVGRPNLAALTLSHA